MPLLMKILGSGFWAPPNYLICLLCKTRSLQVGSSLVI